jgi:cytochrome c-type biogenesis protein CcmH/NrfF
VEQGRSDREILDTYKSLYGTQVLVEPEGTTWWWLQVVPWVALVLGGAFVVWNLKRRRTQQVAGSNGAGLQNGDVPDVDEQ